MNLGKGDVGQILFRSFLKFPTSLERGRYSNYCLEVVTDTESSGDRMQLKTVCFLPFTGKKVVQNRGCFVEEYLEFTGLILGHLVETAAKRNQVLSLKNIKATFLILV